MSIGVNSNLCLTHLGYSPGIHVVSAPVFNHLFGQVHIYTLYNGTKAIYERQKWYIHITTKSISSSDHNQLSNRNSCSNVEEKFLIKKSELLLFTHVITCTI